MRTLLAWATSVVLAIACNLTAVRAAEVSGPNLNAKSELKISTYFNFKKDLVVAAGVCWNKYQVDKREGIIGWCDGDHGDANPTSNSVRYLNTGTEPFHGIPPGEAGYLVKPVAWKSGAKVSEYDNYHWWYVPSEDKFFWIFASGPEKGGRYGIFDMKLGDWSHGNNMANASEWPNGPYWSDYVAPPGDGKGGMTIVKNSPNGYSEALDKAVAISGTRLFIIERNPDHPAKSKAPWRIVFPSVADKPYAVKEDKHNEFMNSGLCVGEWFYFIRPANAAEKASYPDPAMREFWKVRLVPPYDQHKKLAHFPRFDISPLRDVAEGKHASGVFGPLLVYDEASESILAIYDRLWVYDIETDKWTDRTPEKWERILYAVGGMKKSTREIIYRPGSNVDQPKGATIDGHSVGHYWSKIKLEGGEKHKAR